MRGITKRFGDLLANDRIDFTAFPGQIHAILGENGAGKSTLMNVLSGVYLPDNGVVELNGRPVDFHSPRDAVRAGVGMVHQHYAQIPSCTVAQNIHLANPDAPFFFAPAVVEKKVRRLCETYSIDLDPHAKVMDLSAGERQRLELLRLLSGKASILILDEPTAMLTLIESDKLFKVLRGMAQGGKTILFITHKLHEIHHWADRITVLRQGRVKASDLASEQWDADRIISLMVCDDRENKDMPCTAEYPKKRAPGSKKVFEMSQVWVEGQTLDSKIKGIDLIIREGEILAIAGVAGNGQRELAEAAIGIRRIMSGTMMISGNDATKWNVMQTRMAGTGFIPEDRMELGSCQNLSLENNLNLDQYGKGTPFFPKAIILRERADRLAHSMNVIAASLDFPMRFLSGGNMQRAILAREFDISSKLLIASQPTRGLDAATTQSVRKKLREKRNEGSSILLVSYDLDEIIEIADRIVVIHLGRIVANYEKPFPDRKQIGLAMTGGRA